MKLRRKINQHLLRLHRRLGVLLLILAVLLATTGILLNHTDQLRLDSRHLSHPALLSWYGIQPPPLQCFPGADEWLCQKGDSLYLGEQPVADIETSLRGIARTPELLIVATAGELILLTPGGELIERLAAPATIEAIGHQAGDREVILRDLQGRFWSSQDWLTLQPVERRQAVEWNRPQPPPANIQAAIDVQWQAGSLTWERLLLDLHSGRVLGEWGVWLMDAVAVGLILLGLSGFWMHRVRKQGEARRGKRAQAQPS